MSSWKKFEITAVPGNNVVASPQGTPVSFSVGLNVLTEGFSGFTVK